MLEQTSFPIEIAPDEISDLDLTPSGDWIAVTASQNLFFGKRHISIPKEIRYPMVRAIDEDLALVVNPRTRTEPNAWIINSSGDVIRNFFAGDAIQDVLVSDRFIVISYFDESAVSGIGLEGNGVAVFDSSGKYAFGYRELFSQKAVEIVDCYCTCWEKGERLLFFPYTDFPLVSFDLAKKTQEIWATPPEVAGSSAITSFRGSVYFYGPYNDKSGMYKWDFGSTSVSKVGEYSSPLRGLRQGRFIAVGKAGYTIITPNSQT